MPMRRLLIFVVLPVFGFAVPLSAQRTVTGKVTDYRDDRPLAGVNVLVEGRAAATRTDESGRYSLQVPNDAAALRFSLPGYDNARVELTAVSTYDITLKQIDAPRDRATRSAGAALPLWDTIPVARVLNEFGQVELSQILNFAAPDFQSARQTLAEASDHVDPVQLRGMASDQVLVLVNGKRRHQSALVHTGPTAQRGMAQGTDFNAIPASAVERIEVLRDVVGTQYGSDAVAGVVNIILKNKTGLDANVSYGQRLTRFDKNYALWRAGRADQPDAPARDGQTVHAALHGGFGLGSRGRVNLTGEYLSRGATNRTGTFTGRIYPLNPINGMNRDDLLLAQNGLTREDFDQRIGEARMRGGGILYDLDFALNDNWDLYSFGNFHRKKSEAGGDYYRTPAVIDSVTPLFYAFEVLAEFPNGFLPIIHADNRDLGAALGVRGRLDNWIIDLSNTVGLNRLEFALTESANLTEGFQAPPRYQTDFETGGFQLLQNTANLQVSRHVAAALSGLRLTAGLEHRFEQYAVLPGETKSRWNFANPGFNVSPGAQGFLGFEEDLGTHNRNSLGLSVQADQHFAPEFLLSLTGRFDRYSDLGNLLTGKIALAYQPSPVFGAHAAAGTGFRAPALAQRYYQRTADYTATGATGEAGIFAHDDPAVQLFRVGDLQPEKNLGLSAGVTVRPNDDWRLTLDLWQVSVQDRVVLTNAIGPGQSAVLGSLLSNLRVLTVGFWDNAIDTRTSGVEARVFWKKQWGDRQKINLGLSGAFYQNEVKSSHNEPDIDAPGLVVQSNQVAQYFSREDQNRLEGALPRAKAVGDLGYVIGPFGAALRATWFGGTRYRDPLSTEAPNSFTGLPAEPLDQDFAAKMVLDLSLSYEFIPGASLTLGAHNLLDVYPDRHTHSVNMREGRVVYNTDASPFGFGGRYLFARVRYRLD